MSSHRSAARRLLRNTAALVLLAGCPVLGLTADTFTARLSTVPIDPLTAATTTGVGKAAAVLDGTKLTVTGEFSGLAGAATVARLHEGRATGVRGPAVLDFPVPAATSGTFEAELTLTRQQAASLEQGRLYIQIDSATAPDGNLWGWLLAE